MEDNYKVIFVFIIFSICDVTLCFYSASGLYGVIFGFPRICLCRCGLANTEVDYHGRTARLLGGESALPHQYPWLALIHLQHSTIAGALISDQHVITAASPFHGAATHNVFLTLGAHDTCGNVGVETALNMSVASITLHPQYSAVSHHNDIALIKLAHVLPISPYIAPICLPIPGSPEAGRVAWTAAWSMGSSANRTDFSCSPRVASLPILTKRTCFKSAVDPVLVTPDKGCLGPIGSKSIICSTDVGGPVMMRSVTGAFRVAGVLTAAAACDQQVTPLYTRVADHLNWIFGVIRNDCLCF